MNIKSNRLWAEPVEEEEESVKGAGVNMIEVHYICNVYI
jgi:hypothetical protein